MVAFLCALESYLAFCLQISGTRLQNTCQGHSAWFDDPNHSSKEPIRGLGRRRCQSFFILQVHGLKKKKNSFTPPWCWARHQTDLAMALRTWQRAGELQYIWSNTSLMDSSLNSDIQESNVNVCNCFTVRVRELKTLTIVCWRQSPGCILQEAKEGTGTTFTWRKYRFKSPVKWKIGIFRR